MATKQSVSKSGLRPKHRFSRRALINLAIAALVLYVLVPAVNGLDGTLETLARADTRLYALAVVSIAVSYLCAALTYVLLALKTVAYRASLVIQLASGFVNRLLPAGLGGLGLNALFLIRNKHTVPAATAVVTVNNLLGFVGNLLLIGAAFAVSRVVLPKVAAPDLAAVPVWAFGILFLFIVIAVFVARHYGAHVWLTVRQTLRQLMSFRRRPFRLLGALLSSMLLTGLHAAALYFVVQSLGLSLSPAQALIAISIGAFAGAAVPTPGGLGGAEAGLVAACVAYGIPIDLAVPAALGYRLITFWAPLLPGFIMLQVAENKYL